MKCEYNVDDRIEGRRITVNCLECDEIFDLKECFFHVIKIMGDEYNIDNMVFSDDVETQLTGNVVDILGRLGDLCKDIDRVSSKVPKGKECKNCDVSPKKIFGDIYGSFADEPDKVFEAYYTSYRSLNQGEGCEECKRQSEEDMCRFGEELVSLSDAVLRDAYGIIG